MSLIVHRPDRDWIFHVIDVEDGDTLITAPSMDPGDRSDSELRGWLNASFFQRIGAFKHVHPDATACRLCRMLDEDRWASAMSDLVHDSHLALGDLGVRKEDREDVPEDVQDRYIVWFSETFHAGLPS